MMTLWRPDLRGQHGPKYSALADAIALDVQAGRLKPGTRLPTHRDLARRLGVTIGTVSRGYAEAHRRGLVMGEVGRGTFVRATRPEPVGFARSHDPDPNVLELNFNLPTLDIVVDLIRAALARLAESPDLVNVLQYQANAGSLRHREVAARWLSSRGVSCTTDEVVVTSGAQHAMLTVFSVVAEPGDIVLAESVTFPGMKAVARLLRLNMEPVAMDDEGIRPDALAEACRKHRPKALYATPTFQNPTGRVMSEARRRDIAEVARANRLPIVEDDIYGFLHSGALTPLAALSEGSGYYITSFSKSVAPGLRLGYLVGPRAVAPQLAASVMTTTQVSSPVAAEVITGLIEDDTLETLFRRHRKEIGARQAIARALLGHHVPKDSHAESPHVWVNLPDPWRVEEFVAQARARGVALASGEVFAVGRGAVPHGVRVSLGAVRERAQLERALRTVADILSEQPRPLVTGI